MGTITLTGPDGNDVDFQIEGTFPTQDELARFNVVLGNKPQEDTGPAPEVMDTAPSLGTPSMDDASSFLLPDAVPDDTTPSQTAPAIQSAGGTVIGDPPVITEPEKRDSDEILPAGPEIDYSASINRTGSNDTEVDDDTSAAAVSEEQPAPEFTEPDKLTSFESSEDNPVIDTKPSEPVPELPDPSWDMYDVADDLGSNRQERFEIAQEIYEQYENHPSSEKNAIGELSYNGIRVNRPNPTGFTGVGVGLSTKMTNAASDGVRNFGITMALLADIARDKWSDEGLDPDESWSLWLSENTMRSDAGDKWYNALLKGGVELGTGFGTGKVLEKTARYGAGKTAVGRAVSTTSNAVQSGFASIAPATARNLSTLSKFVRGEAYMAAGLDAESGTLLTGDGRAFDWLQGFETVASLNTDPEADDFEKLYAQKRDILMEAIALAAPATALVEGAAWLARVSYAFSAGAWIGGFQQSAKEKFVVEDILKTLTVGSKDPAEMQRKIVEVIKANQDVFIQMDQELLQNIEFKTTAMDALRRGLEGGESSENIRVLLQQAAGIDKGAMQVSGSRVADTLGTVSRELSQGLDNTVNTLGGETAANNTLKNIQDEELAIVGEAEGKVSDSAAAIREQERLIASAMKDDPLFGDTLNRLANRTGIDPAVVARGNADEIIDAVKQGVETLTENRQGYYTAVNQGGGELDIDLLEEALSGFRLSELQDAMNVLPDGGFKRLLGALELADGDDAGDAFQNMVVMLDDAGITDYGKFFDSIRKDAAIAKERLFDAANKGDKSAYGPATRLLEFVNFIDGPLLESAARGIDGAAIRENVDIAKQFDNEIYFPLTTDGVIGDLVTAQRTQGPVNFQDQARQLVAQGLSNDRVAGAAQLMQFLDSEFTDLSSDNAVDYILSKVIEPIANDLDVGGQLTEDSLKRALTDLQTYGAALDSVPDAARRIAEIREGVASAAQPREKLRGFLEDAQKNLAATKQEIFKGQFEQFWKAEGVPYQRGFKIFDDMFNDMAKGGNSGLVQNLTDRIFDTENPLLIEGYQAAMAQKLRTTFFGKTKNTSGDRAASAAKISDEELDATKLLDAARIVFRDKPAFIDGVETALRMAGDETRLKLGKPILGESATAVNQASREAFDRMVTFHFGVLNRMGAIVRSGGQAVTKKLIGGKSDALADQILADPEYFTRVAEKIFKDQDGISGQKMIAESLRIFLYRTGMIRGDDGGSEDDIDAIEEAAQLEAIIMDEYKKIQQAAEMARNDLAGSNPILNLFGIGR
jgi:hypothetical protein